jgi:thiol:disulfide interchange protein DsbC
MNKLFIATSALVLAAASAWAQTGMFNDVSSEGVPAAKNSAASEEQNVRNAIAALAGTKVESLTRSPLPGYYQAVDTNGQVLFVSGDGKYLIAGNVFDVAQKANLTSRVEAGVRLEALKSLSASKRIIFAPANPKHTVTVFTDVDCPYCRQFHKQIAAYNQAGIAVQYVLFPLSSIHPGADKKAVAVWCSQDRNAAYTAAMNGQDPGKKTCDNPVAETTALATKIGIGGTPTILNENGEQVNGNTTATPQSFLAELDRMAAKSGKAPVAAN